MFLSIYKQNHFFLTIFQLPHKKTSLSTGEWEGGIAGPAERREIEEKSMLFSQRLFLFLIHKPNGISHDLGHINFYAVCLFIASRLDSAAYTDH